MRIEEINLNDMSNNKLAYQFLLSQTSIANVDVENTTNARNVEGYSKDSFSFVQNSSELIPDTIKRVFSIENFSNEPLVYDKRMLRLHSSELAAFLFFSGVSEENPIRIPGIENVEFTNASFEASFECVGGGPSRIDVLLKNSNNSVALFLEAKFSEYLHPAPKSVSRSYKNDYERIKINTILPDELARVDLDSKADFKIQKKKGENALHYFYCEGVKQILSHYIAISKGICSSFKSIYLGEILFDFGKPGAHYLSDYAQLYRGLANNLNNSQSNVELLSSVLTYQEVFNLNAGYNLPSSVVQFYHLL